MYPIFCVVLLKNRSRHLIVKSDAFETDGFGADEMNWGLKPHVVRKFFVSPFGHSVDLSVGIKQNFDETADSWYEGYILRSYGKFQCRQT